MAWRRPLLFRRTKQRNLNGLASGLLLLANFMMVFRKFALLLDSLLGLMNYRASLAAGGSGGPCGGRLDIVFFPDSQERHWAGNLIRVCEDDFHGNRNSGRKYPEITGSGKDNLSNVQLACSPHQIINVVTVQAVPLSGFQGTVRVASRNKWIQSRLVKVVAGARID